MNDPVPLPEIYDDLRETLRSGVARLISEQNTRRRRKRALILAGAALLTLSGLAVAASTFVGAPAPESVRSDIAGVDRGMPDALRLNPDVRTARSVATTGASTLWLADLADGGRCLELTTTYIPNVRAPGCETGAHLDPGPIAATLPNDESADGSVPVVIAGHVQSPDAVSLSLSLSDGRNISVPFGAQHFYVIDLTGADAADIRAHGVTLIARDAAGSELARLAIPSDWDASAADVAKQTTIDVTTRSDSDDLTVVLGIDGVLHDPRPASLQIVYGEGDAVDLILSPDGSFHYDVPKDRQESFMTPRHILGRDAQGEVVIDQPIAAVAYWRTHPR